MATGSKRSEEDMDSNRKVNALGREGPTGAGILYLVATPIGNLADISARAVETLRDVDLIAAEDTRHSRPLLQHFGIATPLLALHEHNEEVVADRVVERLLGGESIALISDAGTPLISDPGFPLVREARAAGVRVIPIPGPCALIAALAASGLPTNRFSFEGFPPRNSSARRKAFEALLGDQRTLVFYESSHRIVEFLRDLSAVFPADRVVVIARELTKRFESIVNVSVAEVVETVEADPNMQRGEFVVVIQGASSGPARVDELDIEQRRLLTILLEECSVKSAARLCAKIAGVPKDAAYRAALELRAVTEADSD